MYFEMSLVFRPVTLEDDSKRCVGEAEFERVKKARHLG